MSQRERAIQAARELHATGRYDRSQASTVTLNAFPTLRLSPDQLKALAWPADVRWHGFGQVVDTVGVEVQS